MARTDNTTTKAATRSRVLTLSLLLAALVAAPATRVEAALANSVVSLDSQTAADGSQVTFTVSVAELNVTVSGVQFDLNFSAGPLSLRRRLHPRGMLH